ncbi:hypothetical protein [Enterococcus alishanensis]|uniref:Uncharacterized protein n=1 Tax=Enterococcus alishanensis TaxID=1303817 RepID=A0ABS6TEH4_9ENTE|nr:hypothetical protein [Enterococcus alishanensis]MBV7391304.1 hypothetical protein [Enterococcus alishanensis]
MNQEKWQMVLANFDELSFIDTGFYRIRETENGYKIAYLAPGPCGEKVQNPEITLEKNSDGVNPVSLIDLESTPIVRLQAADQEQLLVATDALLDKFLQAKALTFS